MSQKFHNRPLAIGNGRAGMSHALRTVWYGPRFHSQSTTIYIITWYVRVYFKLTHSGYVGRSSVSLLLVLGYKFKQLLRFDAQPCLAGLEKVVTLQSCSHT